VSAPAARARDTVAGGAVTTRAAAGARASPGRDARAGLSISIGQHSDPGAKAENQDSLGAAMPSGGALALKGIVVAVADGISSSTISREAADTAVRSLLTDYYSTPESWSVKSAASRVIAATNAWLCAQSAAARVTDVDRGLVTTLSALILKGRDAHVFHVGDSRIARVTRHGVEPLTEDHVHGTAAEERYLTRALGARPRVEIDYRRVPLEVGDLFLLTTDGVHDHVDARTVRAALETATLDDAARALATAARERGSSDNLTVQIVRIDTLPTEDGTLAPTDDGRLPVPPPPAIGDVLDGFEIIRELTHSARSHLFLASTPDGTRVALKLPATEIRDDPVRLHRFALEEWIARRIDSPHVARAVAAPAPRTALFVATEYIEGRTLRQWLTDHPAPDLAIVRDIAEQIVKALRALHRREMVHQDLRPENVMIDTHGTVKLIDFGSASVAGVEEAAPGTAGCLAGTLQYTAPEYLSGDVVSWRSDQFALGVIVYEMLTGALPYGTRVAQVRTRQDQIRLRYESAQRPDRAVPPWIDFALRRATHPDPLRRYDALSEFLVDLARPSQAYRARRQRPLAERHPVRFWQAVSAVLAVIVVVLLATGRGA